MARLGLALGGGGIVGSAHIGVLMALEEAGIKIDYIAGCSAGAIVAALYAYGYTTQEMMKIIPNITKRYLDYDYRSFFSKIIKRNTQVQGLVKGKRLRDLIADLTNHSHISAAKMPIALLAVDLKQAHEVIFTSRPFANSNNEIGVITDIALADAVQASFSVPVLFKPVTHGNRVLVDGGVINNCPISGARALGADKVIAVDLVYAEPTSKPFHSLFSVLSRVVSINLYMQAKHITKDADVILRPQLSSVGILDFSMIQACVEAGYECTRQQIHAIRQLFT